jgi:hypothetical protein
VTDFFQQLDLDRGIAAPRIAIGEPDIGPAAFQPIGLVGPIAFGALELGLEMGVREATFGFYFTQIGLPLESAIALSFIGAALIMLFSVSGGVTYALRGGRSA